MSLVLAGVHRVRRLACACTVHSSVTHEGFSFACKLAKMCVHGCAHAIRVILNAGTMHASIKFELSCTVLSCLRTLEALACF